MADRPIPSNGTTDTPSPKDSGMGTGAPTDRRDSPFKQTVDLSDTVLGGEQAGASGIGPAGDMAVNRHGPTTGDIPGDNPGRAVQPSAADRAQGVVEQHVVNVAGNPGVARDAGLPGSGGEGTMQAGAGGSGSTTDAPSTSMSVSSGVVGGTTALGSGGPTDRPGGAPPVSSAGRSDQRTDSGQRDTQSPEGRAFTEYEKARGQAESPTEPPTAGPAGRP